MIVKISNKSNQIRQENRDELSGNIWASYNCDFLSNPGKIRISPQTQVVLTNVSTTAAAIVYDAQFGLPTSFVITDTDSTMRIWAVTTGALFNNNNGVAGSTSALIGWKQDALGSTPTTTDTNSDATEFNGALIVSLPTTISELSGVTWTTSWNSISLTTDIPHPLCVSFNNLLLIGNGNKIVSVDIADNINTSKILLGVEYEIQWIRSTNSMVFIGARNKKSERAKVFAWDGHSENFTGDYKINGRYSICGVIKNDVCYTMNEVGELLIFNGGGFEQIAVFPNFNRKLNFNITSGAVRNWMTVQDDNIYILLDSSVTSISYGLENMRAGVWCFNKNVGLHHCYSLTKDTEVLNYSMIDYGSPYITNAGTIFPLQRTNGTFLIGAGISQTGAGSAKYYASVIRELETDTFNKCGYFITPQIPTQEVEEMWQKLFVLIKKLINSTDKIVVKYRVDKRDIIETAVLGTWTSTTTFTSTDTGFADVSAGDEVEIIEGEGSGLSAHISTISYSNPTWTITIDETISGASGNIRVCVWNWTKIGTIDTQGLRNFEFGIGENSNWIQFKVVCFFSGKNEIEKLIIKSATQLKSV